jgi:hypothetical protein
MKEFRSEQKDWRDDFIGRLLSKPAILLVTDDGVLPASNKLYTIDFLHTSISAKIMMMTLQAARQ